MHARTIFAAVALLVASACARPAPQTVAQTFENSDEGWIPYGTDAQVEVTHDRALVKSGESALAIHYKYNSGQYGSAVLPLEGGQFARTPNLAFWIRTDMATPVVVVLSERQPGGGYYSSWFWCPKDQWQHVELAPPDFILNTGPGDPKDANGRLDPDRVNGIGISDLGQAFQAVGLDPAYPLVIERGTGAHTIAIDDFTLASKPNPRPDGLIGNVGRGFLTWVTLGGARLKIAGAENPLHAPALEATYAQAAGRYVLIAHTLANADLGGATKLNFRMASTGSARFVVYLEEKQPGSVTGPRYMSMISIPGGGQATDEPLLFSSFTFDRTGPADPDGRLTTKQLKSISLVDVTAAEGPGSASNTVWIGALQPQ